MRLHIPKGRNIISDVYQETFCSERGIKKSIGIYEQWAPFFLVPMMMMRCSLSIYSARNCQPTLLISMKRMEKLTGFFKKNWIAHAALIMNFSFPINAPAVILRARKNEKRRTSDGGGNGKEREKLNWCCQGNWSVALPQAFLRIATRKWAIFLPSLFVSQFTLYNDFRSFATTVGLIWYLIKTYNSIKVFYFIFY